MVRHTEKSNFITTNQHLFIFDDSEPMRFIIALGTKEPHSYNSDLTTSLQAGLSQSLIGSPEHLIPLRETEGFVRQIKKWGQLSERIINAMLSVKNISQPQSLDISTPEEFRIVG